jgi:hypothetical protein
MLAQVSGGVTIRGTTRRWLLDSLVIALFSWIAPAVSRVAASGAIDVAVRSLPRGQPALIAVSSAKLRWLIRILGREGVA